MCNTTFFRPHELKSPLPLTHQQPPSPFSLSTFQFLRNCNRLILTNSSQRFMLPEVQMHYDPITENRNDLIGSNILQQMPPKSLAYNSHTNITMGSGHQTEAVSQQLFTSNTKQQHSEVNGSEILDPCSEACSSNLSTVICIEPELPEVIKPNVTDSIRSKELRPLSNIPPAKTSPHRSTPTNKRSNVPPLPSFEYISSHAKTPNEIRNDPYGSTIDLTSHLNFNRIASIGGMIPAFACIPGRRSRGEKRTIPEEQKDEKYYERRKRNNEAAKKSRDARKIREDRTALRAALLEQENSILRAQVMSLRDELTTLKHLFSSTSVQSRGTTLI